MKPTDRKAFSLTLQTLATAFGRESETPLFEAYWQGLSDLDLATVTSACMRALRQCKYMPKPAELRELAGVLTPQQRSLKAWSAVLVAIPAVGSYQSVDFSDPLINLSVRLTGGWRHLCNLSTKELDFARKTFEAHYQGLVEHPPRPEDCLHLPGRSELENLADGQRPQKPVRVDVELPPAKMAPALPERAGAKPRRLT